MKVCLVHNAYGKRSGEEVMVDRIASLLRAKGHSVEMFLRESSNIRPGLSGKAAAFVRGFHGGEAVWNFEKLLDRFAPDIVQVQNVYPLISPVVCRQAAGRGIPVVLRCANYRLVCPTGLHMNQGGQCESCLGGREYSCVLKNCEGDFWKSVGYAARNWWARQTRAFLDNVSVYITQTEFQKRQLAKGGIPADRMMVIPNMTDPVAETVAPDDKYVLYVGRVSREKGVDVLIEAARSCSWVPFVVAGDYSGSQETVARAPSNVSFLGHIRGDALGDIYGRARMVVVPSICFEGFPSVLLEAMIRKKPVVASEIGGLPEIVRPELTGLLFRPGDAKDLARKIAALWENPARCRSLGSAGFNVACRDYSQEAYYRRLMCAYDLADKMKMSLRV